VILPGYTHLSVRSRLLAAHYWLPTARVQRDRQRLIDCRRRTNVLPLGTRALADSLPIDRVDVAVRLVRERGPNSIDAASDATSPGVRLRALRDRRHLSTWAEEWILWSTVEFKSSSCRRRSAPARRSCLKRSIRRSGVDPRQDRARDRQSANVAGVSRAALAYNRDLQEDKLPLFDSFDTVRASLELAAPLVAGAE